MKEFFTKIHYARELSLIEKLAVPLLAVGVPFYWLASQLKNFLYDNNFLVSEKIEGAFVISVGNITTGGVGKTPIVAQMANYLSQKHKVAILSRGYGGKLNNEVVNVIKNDGKINFDAENAGDEPFWLSQNSNSNVSVLTCKCRVDAAKYAVQNLGCDVLILDDGFQHRKIARDLDIIVFDAFKMVGNGSVLPLGPLREPSSNIKRADKIILANKNLSQKAFENVYNILSKTTKKKIVTASFAPDKIYDIKTEFELPQKEGYIGAFCAIGQPMSFYSYLNNYNIKFVKDYDDHYLYTQSDVDFLVDEAKKHNANVLITTEKDAVKLQKYDFRGFQICALKLKSEIDVEELLGEQA